MASDKTLQQIEKALQKVYAQAQKEVQTRLDAYNDKIRAQIKQIEDLEDAGRITQDEAWDMKSAIYMRPSRLKPLLANISADYTNANQTAMGIVNGALPAIYAENYNEAMTTITNTVERSGLDISGTWDLYDRDTVNRLATQKPDLLPTRSVNIPKDLRWNQNHIRSALVQGIIQGDSIDHLADRLQRVTDMNRNAAIRNARTMVTGAENAGRQASYDRMSSRGIKNNKIWIATHDSRVRDAHEVMDGQEVPEDEYFTDGEGNRLQYPGDPSGEPSSVYNCRCSMRVKVIGFEKRDGGVLNIEEENRKAAQEVQKEIDETEKQTGHRPERNEYGVRPEYGDDLTDEQLINIIRRETGASAKEARQIMEVMDEWVAVDYYMEPTAEWLIDHSPKYSGPMYRGIALDSKEEAESIIARMKNGNMRDIGRPDLAASWSRDNSIATVNYASASANDIGIVFETEHGHSRSTSISHFRQGKGLEEVIVHPDAEWEYISHTESIEDGVLIFRVKVREKGK